MKNSLERNLKSDKFKPSLHALPSLRGVPRRSNLLTGTKPALLAPVILGRDAQSVPRILLQRVSNLVNKFALLLHTCWLREDTWDKPKYDWCRGRWFCAFSQSGRSMIEMLGVLAIIAVLSVGGIAGYSKAMEKYKLIKYREGMVELISNFLQIKDELPTSNTTHTTNYPEIMHEMGLIPAEFEYVNQTTLKDRFGVAMNIYHDGRPGENHYNFSFHFTNSRLSSLACHELLETVIEFRNDVHELYRQPFGVPSGADEIPYYRVLGSRFCVKGEKCLSNLTMNDIHEICYYYKGKSEDYIYAVQFYFKD